MGRIEPQQISLRNGVTATLHNPQIEDAEPLLEFLPRVLSETEFLSEAADFSMTVEQEREWIQNRLDCPGSIAVMAIVDGRIVGTCGLDRGRRRRFAHTAVLGISILSDYCGQGLGRAMMNRLIEFAESSEVLEKVKLEVFSHNTRAIKLYESVGFTEEGRSVRAVRYPDGRYVDDVHMARFVKSVALCGTLAERTAPGKEVRL